MKTKKFRLLAAFCSFCILLCLLFISDYRNKENKPLTSASHPNSDQRGTGLVFEDIQATTNGEIESPDQGQIVHENQLLEYDDDWCRSEELTQNANRIAIFEQDSWLEQRGYFSNQDLESYKAYDTELLRTLGERGDLAALHELVWKSLENRNQTLANEALHTAAVWGSSQAFLFIASNHFLAADLLLRDGNTEESMEEQLLALAYLEVATMRNDLQALKYGIRELRKSDIELSKERLQSIESKAKDIYRELEQERSNLALTPFENTIPTSVARYNDMRSARYALEGWNGWGKNYLTNNDCVHSNIETITQLEEVSDSLAQFNLD